MDLKKIPRGEINGVPMITKFKKVMIELFKGYPGFQYFGIFESYFGRELGEEIVRILRQDKLLDTFPKKEDEPTRYRLTDEGVNMAISMINLDYSGETKRFTVWIIVLALLTFLLGLNQVFFAYLQYRAMG